MAQVRPLDPSQEPQWLDGTSMGAAARVGATLVDIFSATAARHPERVALEGGGHQLTYVELARDASVVARRLAAAGVRQGDRVGIRVPSGSVDLYVAILGTLLAGAAYVPVDFADPEERAETIWRDADVCAVLTVGLDIAPARAIRRPPALDRVAPPPAASVPPPPPRPDDACWIIFTSGSTGAPKGVVVTHRSAAAFVDAEAQLFDVGPADRVLAGLSVGFDASCEEMWLAWRHGAALVACPRAVVQAGVDLGPWLVQHRVTVVSTVPTLAAMWDDAALAGVRLLVLGGEACPDQLGWRLAAGRAVWNTYGPTEATVVTTAAPITVGDPVTIGHPLPGWDVAVVDQSGCPVEPGVSGELVVGGIGLGRYLDPDLDASCYGPLPALGWPRAYRTGDMVRWTPRGLQFLGRRDDQVKIGGRRIELGEIDAALADAPGVAAAATTTQTSAGGNTLLVGYVAGSLDVATVRADLEHRLPRALVPVLVHLDMLPTTSSGKVDRRALPWPPPTPLAQTAQPALPAQATRPGDPDRDGDPTLSPTATWLAQCWTDQLGPLAITPDSDFFDLGGTSLSAAKLVSVLRARFPGAAIADVYDHRTLQSLAHRLDHLTRTETVGETPHQATRRWGLVRLGGTAVLVTLGALQWLVGLFAYNQFFGIGPRIGWAAVVGAWLVLSSAPGRAAIVVVLRRALLPRLRPGRYRREGWLAARLWFAEHAAETLHAGVMAGTPWALRTARLMGSDVGDGARLGTLPSPASLVHVGPGATIEGDVDLRGWWVDGTELVLGAVRIGADARIGTRSVLLPGADIGDGAEIEPGSVVSGHVPAGERWSGSPARCVGEAGEAWGDPTVPVTDTRTVSKARYAGGLAVASLLPLVAGIPTVALLFGVGDLGTVHRFTRWVLALAPVLTISYLCTYAALLACTVRALGRSIHPGIHVDRGRTGWALWLTDLVLTQSRGILFPLYASVYTRRWLRLLGLDVGHRSEVSTAVGLHRLVTLGETSFVTDDVVFAAARARGGWLEVAPIVVGDRSFVGNSAVLQSGTTVGDDSLVGVLSTPPAASAAGTSWLGVPALELPRSPKDSDPARTVCPPRRLVAARGAVEAVRILMPTTVSAILGILTFAVIENVGTRDGALWLLPAVPLVLAVAGLCAVGCTILAKWILMGRYRPGTHPLWSSFVWRDELVNSMHEQLAGAWLLDAGVGTPLLPAYIRAMGGRVGTGVWFESLNVTEFDLVDLGDGCVVNRGAVMETHLFHDRLFQLGPATLGPGATLGPHTATLPDTEIGAGCTVGARSVVMRGESLPPGSRWHGIPVTPAG